MILSEQAIRLTSPCPCCVRDLLPAQRSIAMISEMIHTASLVHDDVIDGADTRRGKTTINEVWGEKKVSAFRGFSLHVFGKGECVQVD